jgi:uncharacterized protein (TIGR02996 family)
MQHQETFLAAILESPEDDLPRLAYADWLEEQGDPRSEFIRVQIEFSRNPFSPRQRALQKRQNELLMQHGSVWARPLDERNIKWEFHRGFIESVSLASEQFAKEASWLFGVAPIRAVTFGDLLLDKLIACPHLDRIKEVVIPYAREDPLSADEWRRWFTEPRWEQLTALTFSQRRIDAARARALATSAVFPRLEKLTVIQGGLSRDVAAALFSSPLPRLTRVKLLSSAIGREGLAALLASCSPDQLQALNLDFSQIGDEGAHQLARVSTWTHLEELELRSNSIRASGARALASVRWPALKKLTLGFDSIGDEGLRSLAGAAAPPQLAVLEVNYNYIGPQGVEALTASPLSWNLSALDLSNNPIGDEGVSTLVRSRKLNELQSLDLEDCKISLAGCRALLNSSLGKHLCWLNLERAKVTPGLFEKFRARMGDGFWHEEVLAEYLKANPPTFLRKNFLCRADTPVARQAPEKTHRRVVVTYELAHPDLSQRATLLGRQLEYEEEEDAEDPMAGLYPDFYPLAIRWEPFGEVRELGGPFEPSNGEGAPDAWLCPHPGCEEHIVLVSFSYEVDPPTYPPSSDEPVQDSWKNFWLDVYCVKRRQFIRVLDHD